MFPELKAGFGQGVSALGTSVDVNHRGVIMLRRTFASLLAILATSEANASIFPAV